MYKLSLYGLNNSSFFAVNINRFEFQQVSFQTLFLLKTIKNVSYFLLLEIR